VQVNVPLIHQVVVAQLAAARQGTHTPRPAARSAAVAASRTAEGHRPRPPGLDPRAAVRRRWRRPRPARRATTPAHPKKMKAAALRGALSDRARARPRPRRRPPSSPATPLDQGRARGARGAHRPPQPARRARARRPSPGSRCATSPRCTCSRRPAQHLRRAVQRRRRLHQAALGVPRRPGRQVGQGRATARPSEASSAELTHVQGPRDILLAPVVSEKSYGLLDENKYTFLVDPRRQQDRDQDRGREGLRRQGDQREHHQPQGKRKRTRPARQAPDTKRAIVTLAEGDRIDIFGGPVS
jgi:large subunit ribosomal protein L23